MSKGLSESAIVRSVARQAGERIARKVIADLRRMKHLHSGDDTELKSTWEEVCVQVQYEQSLLWDAYDETVRSVVSGKIAALAPHELDALWLQSIPGLDWKCTEEAEREPHPVFDGDVVDHLTRAYVYKAAGDWSNPRIRAFINRSVIPD